MRRATQPQNTLCNEHSKGAGAIGSAAGEKTHEHHRTCTESRKNHLPGLHSSDLAGSKEGLWAYGEASAGHDAHYLTMHAANRSV